jgi:hypothetical protein
MLRPLLQRGLPRGQELLAPVDGGDAHNLSGDVVEQPVADMRWHSGASEPGHHRPAEVVQLPLRYRLGIPGGSFRARLGWPAAECPWPSGTAIGTRRSK